MARPVGGFGLIESQWRDYIEALEHERDFLARELGFKNTQRQEIERLREMLEDLIHMLDGAGMKALARKLRTEMPNSRDYGGGGNRTRVSVPTEE
jgi:hypothetical protein